LQNQPALFTKALQFAVHNEYQFRGKTIPSQYERVLKETIYHKVWYVCQEKWRMLRSQFECQ